MTIDIGNDTRKKNIITFQFIRHPQMPLGDNQRLFVYLVYVGKHLPCRLMRSYYCNQINHDDRRVV